MGGGLLQLVAYGSQDVYLTGNPQITLFKNVYQRHTNFSTEPFEVPFDGIKDFGQEISCTISKNGDLVSKTHLIVKLNSNTTKTWGYVNKIGYSMIDYVSVIIGGTEIDRHYGNWLNIWHELSSNLGHNDGFNKMIGNVSSMTKSTEDHNEYTLYIPLEFWFCRHYGLSIPLIALQNRNIDIKVKLRPVSEIFNYTGTTIPTTNLPSISSISLLVDYIFLDTDERKKFANFNHEYLIEQVQFYDEPIRSYNEQYEIIFNHPCKALIWTTHLDRYRTRNTYLTWAEDDDWETTKTNFSKLVWLASREGLSNDGTYITIDSSVTNIGDVPSDLSGGNATIETLGAKVTGYLLFADTSGGITTANAILDNVAVTNSTITYEDMSYTIDELETDAKTTTAQSAFFDLHQVNVIDHFNYGNWINRSDNPIISSVLKLNGHNRFSQRDGSYFNYLQPYQHFKNTPSDGINCYSFALKPLEHQPSGTCNFSRIDTAVLDLIYGKNNTDDEGTHYSSHIENGMLEVYAINYNVMKIASGVSGLAYMK